MRARFEYFEGNNAVYSFRGPRSHRRVYITVPYADHDACANPFVLVARSVINDAMEKVINESGNNSNLSS